MNRADRLIKSEESEMNRISTTIILVASLTSFGCAGTAPMTASCAGVPSKKVTIIYQKNSKITVAPPEREIEQGQAIEFFVKGPAARSFSITGTGSESGAAANWIGATGTGSNAGTSVFVCVDAGQDVTGYTYLVKVTDVGELDPVVRVKTKGRD